MPSMSTLLTPERISLSSDTPSKKRVLQTLSCLLAKESSLDKTEIFTVLFNREKLGSTAIGNGVAIPHARLAGCSKPVGAFLQITPGLSDFNQDDKDSPVDLFFGLLVPEDCTQGHLNILAELAEFFSDKHICEDLRSAKNTIEIYQIFLHLQTRAAIV